MPFISLHPDIVAIREEHPGFFSDSLVAAIDDFLMAYVPSELQEAAQVDLYRLVNAENGRQAALLKDEFSRTISVSN